MLEPFEEPEREFRKRNKKTRANKVRPRALIFEMGEEAPMWTARRAAPTVPTNPITKPNLDKEIPGKLLHMIKDLTFDGKNDSNPIVHMENFVDICDLFKTEEGRDDAIRLRVFPLTLAGEARAWLRSLEPSSITTWEGLRSNFLSRFFPPSKIDKLKADIRSFQQDDGETISEAWERFKHLLNSCPSHG
ncbi:MAG TPA: retrotransposon gag family protein, partial [Candidatus Paceibacterota bacterium]|nr:retrotransposon gag family protein [Candidatus Paceibacterota bacterium]